MTFDMQMQQYQDPHSDEGTSKCEQGSIMQRTPAYIITCLKCMFFFLHKG